MKTLSALFMWAFLCVSTFTQGAIIYVDIDATGSNSGASWNNAYTDLQDAIAVASSDDEIWVAEGIYKPTNTADRSFNFTIGSGTSLFGGFEGTETDRDQRNWADHPTVLSGEIGSPSDTTDNSYNILYAVDGGAVIDGFSIQDAHRDFSDTVYPRGGVYIGGESGIELKNCDINSNTAPFGSAISTLPSAYLSMENCLVRDNLSNQSSLTHINQYSTAKIYNCTFTENEFEQTFGNIIGGNSSAYIICYNSIIWNNDDIQPFGSSSGEIDKCVVDIYPISAGYSIGDVSTDDPEFIDPANGNFQLQNSSSALDFGQNGLIGSTLDLAGNPRTWNNTIDAGCFELQTHRKLLVDHTANGNNDGSTWYHAFEDLQSALAEANAFEQIWVAEGIYTPTTGTSRSSYFSVPTWVGLYGGFSGNENHLDERDWNQNPTVLSGEIGDLNDITDNSYRIIRFTGTDGSIDGFDISGAYHEPGSTSGYQGALSVGTMNSGWVNHCNIHSNTANTGSAIFSVSDSFLIIANSVIHNNLNNGGAIVSSQSGSVIQAYNCTVTRNEFLQSYGSVFGGNSSSEINLFNSIVWNNDDHKAVSSSAASIYNSTIDVYTSSLSHVIGDTLMRDPAFVDADNADFSLQAWSPVRDFGNTAYLFGTQDLAGNIRNYGPSVDAGAYELLSCGANNDLCENFLDLTVDASFFVGTNKCASPNDDVASACSAGVGRSVWFRFIAPLSGNVQVVTASVGAITDTFDMRLAAYSGDCSALTQVGCADSFSDETPESMSLYGISPGVSYLIRLDGADMQEATFKIQVLDSGDVCAGDYNNDGNIDTNDLLMFLAGFGCQSNCPLDLTNDDVLDTSDLLAFLSLFGTSCD